MDVVGAVVAADDVSAADVDVVGGVVHVGAAVGACVAAVVGDAAVFVGGGANVAVSVAVDVVVEVVVVDDVDEVLVDEVVDGNSVLWSCLSACPT